MYVGGARGMLFGPGREQLYVTYGIDVATGLDTGPAGHAEATTAQPPVG